MEQYDAVSDADRPTVLVLNYYFQFYTDLFFPEITPG